MGNDNDLLGTKAIGNAIEKSADGIGSFLSKICMPVAEELGLYFQDKVKAWRARNAASVATKAEGLLGADLALHKSVHPLLAWRIMEQSSLTDSDDVQDFWAGLLASSCEETPSDKNVIFLDILGQLTAMQVRVIKHICGAVKIEVNKRGFIHPTRDPLSIDIDELIAVAGSDDLHRVDMEIDRLDSLGLFWGGANGIVLDLDKAMVTPSPLCLHLYARCCGHSGDPVEFYRDQIVQEPEK